MSMGALRVVLLVVGSLLVPEGEYFLTAADAAGLAVYGIGYAIWMYGCYIWVKLKNRHGAWTCWGLAWPFGLVAIALLGDRLSAEERKDCFLYLNQQWETMKLQERAADPYNSALLKYGMSAMAGPWDQEAMDEIRKSTKGLKKAAEDIRRARASVSLVPACAMASYSSWHVTDSDFHAWVSAQSDAMDALAEGRMPNSDQVQKLYAQHKKSFDRAAKEDAKLIKRVNPSPTEMSTMLSRLSGDEDLERQDTAGL